MEKKRLFTYILSLLAAGALYFVLSGHNDFFFQKNIRYASNIVLAVYFFAVLVSHQQFEEDFLLKIERFASVLLFSFIFYFQLIYAPLADYFFKTLITKSFFLSDILALLFFMLFMFLSVTTLLVLNSFTRFGLLSEWTIFNNETSFYALRLFWLAGVALAAYLYAQSPYLIISS